MPSNISPLTADRSRPQILLVTNVFSPKIGGTGAVALAIAENLPAHVSVLAPGMRGEAQMLKQHDRQMPFAVFRVREFFRTFPGLPPGKMRAVIQLVFDRGATRPQLASTMRRLQTFLDPQVVCINALEACHWIPAVMKKRNPHLKDVFYLHGEEIGAGSGSRMRQLTHQSLREADAVVVISSYTREQALLCGVDPAKITVIPNGVDVQRFSPGEKSPRILERYAPDGQNILLCLARLDERKGQDSLLRAMPEILRGSPETVLLIVGEGDQEQHLKSLATELNLHASVFFTGKASDSEVVDFYRSCDVYVMPNRTTPHGDTEGFGLVFLEAGACQKPVVGGRAGGVPDAIIDGHTGLLVDGIDPAGIARACLLLLKDQRLAAEMGYNGLMHARANTWPIQAQKFLRVCEKLTTPNLVEMPGSQAEAGADLPAAEIARVQRSARGN